MKGSRRKSRILAFQAVYSYDFNNEKPENLSSFNWLDRDNINRETKAFASLLLTGTMQNLVSIDEQIKKHIDNWKFERISKVDLAILRISVYSLMYQKDIVGNITIDEAVDISREYSSDDSFRFINGVLDSIYKEINQKQVK